MGKREPLRTANMGLKALPDDEAVLAALLAFEDDRRYRYGATAAAVAGKLQVQGARRMGSGAVAGSWTGYMSGALRIAPRLAALHKRGLVVRWYDDTFGARSRRCYALSDAGRARLAEQGKRV